MDIFMPMSTTWRHNKITRRLGGNLLDLEEKENAIVLQEDCSLVYFGSENKVSDIRLVDLADITNEDDFINDVIDDLKTTEPDLVLFHHNKFLVNRRETKFAGQPDLIVEVWSKGNTQKERDFKRYLYSTSEITEHWYIEQDSNDVECWHGSIQLKTQKLNHIIRTQKGIEFDLRYLTL